MEVQRQVSQAPVDSPCSESQAPSPGRGFLEGNSIFFDWCSYDPIGRENTEMVITPIRHARMATDDAPEN